MASWMTAVEVAWGKILGAIVRCSLGDLFFAAGHTDQLRDLRDGVEFCTPCW